MLQVEKSQTRVRRRHSSNGGSPLDGTGSFGESLNDPLRGVVVCLTGLPGDQKTRLHSLVQDLGGKYARDLDTSQTTHLIAPAPEGAKYQTASSCGRIHIVSPSWLEACRQEKIRVDEKDYLLESRCAAAPTENKSCLRDQIKEQLQTKSCMVFSSCQFLLLGFEEDSELKTQLSRLIRWGMGTIYWELNEAITHVIVNDACKDEFREVARTLSLHHPNGPASISPWWVLASWKGQRLHSPSDYVPAKQVSVDKPLQKTKRARHSKKPTRSLFHGSLFCLVRLSPPEGTVDFDSKQLEKLITLHGGQMLSEKWMDALKADSQKENCPRRKVYVVAWGGYTPTHMTIHPLLSQVKRNNLCDIVAVAPIWVQTCVMDEKIVIPERHGLLFEPQSWAMRRIDNYVSGKTVKNPKGKTMKNIKVSVTGFVGHERTGIIHVLRAIGAEYTESMRNSNTHLICKESKGPKFQKALEWGLHVVSVDWLHHVVQYGYGGARRKDNDAGCEEEYKVTGMPKCSQEDSPLKGTGPSTNKKQRVCKS